MSAPVRLQLSRKKGFGLQAFSHATNGLKAVNVARPSRYGNPFRLINEEGWPWITDARDERFPSCNAGATKLLGIPHLRSWEDARRGVVALFKAECVDGLKLEPLIGHNLACWCAADCPCHADVLLALVNVRSV